MQIRGRNRAVLLTLAMFVINCGVLLPVSATEPARVPDLALLKAAAEGGDPRAQLEYGKALEHTRPDESFKWLSSAGAKGQGEGWFRIAYALGRGPEYYVKAAELGYGEAFNYALDDLLFRAGAAADVTRAKQIGDLARRLRIEEGYGTGKISRNLDTVDLCFNAGEIKIPDKDQPTAAEAASFGKAERNCTDYHEGIGVPKDDRAYLKCLLSSEDRNNNDLAEVYANGWGVPRNPTLAMALACHGSEVPAELDGMVQTLEQTRNEPELKRVFTFCDQATSGMNSGICAAKAEYVRSARRGQRFAQITSSWTRPDRERLDKALAAYEEFITTHSVEELDMSGTARGQIAVEEEAGLRDKLAESIRSFEQGKPPLNTDLARIDAELNQVYQRIMKAKAFQDYVTPTRDGIRNSQRKWLTYRDRFVEFAVNHYPQTKKEVWLAWLTSSRVEQLKEVASMVLE